MLTAEDECFLREREEIITHALHSFLEVGRALSQIRDYKSGLLYKRDYGTFENYCRKRWAFGRQRGYELMDAVKTHDGLSAQADKEGYELPLPNNEKQLRHLKRMTPDQGLKAWKNASERTVPGQQVRSQAVAKAVREVSVQYALPLNDTKVDQKTGDNDAIIILASVRRAAADIRGARVSSLLKANGTVYLKLGSLPIMEGIQVLQELRCALLTMIALTTRSITNVLPGEPIPFEPILVGVHGPAEPSAKLTTVVLETECVADWTERRPSEFIRYIYEKTPGKHICRTLDSIIGLRDITQPDQFNQ